MSRRGACARTLDLLDWQPREADVRRYDEDRVRASSLRARITHAVAETLRDCEHDRGEIARRMSEWLGEDVSKNMLDAYASEARDDHSISYLRLLALVHVTGDIRPLQTGAEMFDHVVVADGLLDWVEVGRAYEVERQARQMVRSARRRVGRGG